jgi:hypothetical protein
MYSCKFKRIWGHLRWSDDTAPKRKTHDDLLDPRPRLHKIDVARRFEIDPVEIPRPVHLRVPLDLGTSAALPLEPPQPAEVAFLLPLHPQRLECPVDLEHHLHRRALAPDAKVPPRSPLLAAVAARAGWAPRGAAGRRGRVRCEVVWLRQLIRQPQG